jgi:ABC-type multidrug transport system fused ATPase/permease subunit
LQFDVQLTTNSVQQVLTNKNNMAKRRFDYNDDAPKTKVTKENFRDALKIFKFIEPYKWSMVGGMITLFLSSLSFMILTYSGGLMVDVAKGESKYNVTLSQLGTGLIIIFLAQGFLSYLRVLLFAKVSEKGIADIRMALYSRLVALPIPFFEQSRVGELISRVTNDVERLYNTFSVTLAEFLRQIIVFVAGLGFLIFTSPELAKVMVLTIPVVVIGAMFFGRFIRKMSKERQSSLADTNIVLSETMTSINAVKAFTNEWFEIKRYKEANDKTVSLSMKSASARGLFAVFIIVIVFGAIFFVLWQGAMMLQAGKITTGELINFFMFTLTVGTAIASIGNFYPELVSAIGATERVREILNMTPELDIHPNPIMPERKFKGVIEFKDVHFRYPTRTDVEVLKGLNLTVEAGQKVALVGPSGAGKSTIVQLILKFYNPTEGGVYVDGKNINDYNLSEYRSNMAFVPQEVLLFGGTIRENILYGKPDANEDEIIEAAKKSNSWEFISQFPEGLDTIVGERGIKLSGGQRQRIAIARAILRNPSILLLDEATSSLDAESEKVVQEALNALMDGRTSVIIAHRLATVREVDKICVIDKGIVVEEGTHEELADIEDGLYASLAKLQFENMM